MYKKEMMYLGWKGNRVPFVQGKGTHSSWKPTKSMCRMVSLEQWVQRGIEKVHLHW